MNETNLLTAELLKIVQATGTFAIEQAPGFAKEFLQWEFYSHLFQASLSFTAASLMAYFLYNLIKEKKQNDNFEVVGILTISSLAFFFFIVSLIEFHSVAKVKFAPKVYLVENIAKIIK